jgi:hypothetical protein
MGLHQSGVGLGYLERTAGSGMEADGLIRVRWAGDPNARFLARHPLGQFPAPLNAAVSGLSATVRASEMRISGTSHTLPGFAWIRLAGLCSIGGSRSAPFSGAEEYQ